MNRNKYFSPFEIKEVSKSGEFEGYGSVYGNVDKGMDIVHRGAFAESLASRKPKMLWQHDDRSPMGIWVTVEEQEKGLYLKGQCAMETQVGREAHALLKLGALDGLSIGYRTTERVYDDDGVRHILKAELWEVSVVTFPMNDQALVSAVKIAGGYTPPRTQRELEDFLRDAGMSRRAAKALAAVGFAAVAERDARDAERSETGDDLVAHANLIREILR